MVLITSVIASQVSNCVTQNLSFPYPDSGFKVLSLSQSVPEMLMAASSFKLTSYQQGYFYRKRKTLS